ARGPRAAVRAERVRLADAARDHRAAVAADADLPRARSRDALGAATDVGAGRAARTGRCAPGGHPRRARRPALDDRAVPSPVAGTGLGLPAPRGAGGSRD